MAVRQYTQALTLLESIPQRHRTPKVNMKLGHLYQQAGMERPAITAYKEVLKVSLFYIFIFPPPQTVRTKVKKPLIVLIMITNL